MHGSSRLGMAELAEQCADGDDYLFIDTGGADFGLGSRSYDIGHDFGHGVNGSIKPWASSGRLCRIGQTVSEKIMATVAASDAGRGKVRGVAMTVWNHVAGGVPNGGVGVGIGVVEEPQGCIICLFGGL